MERLVGQVRAERARREELPSSFEAATRAQLEALREEVRELKGRVNGLLWTVVAAVAVDVAKTLLK